MKSVNTDIAYNYLRKKILNGDYPPGHALQTEILAAEIKVSRTPVRDALRKLETDGLVTIRAHLGASVKKMELKEFRDMCELRLALESHAAGLAAANHTDIDLREILYALEAMKSLTERMEASAKEQPLLNELAMEDVRFHLGVIGAARNELMKSEILRLHLINRVVAGPAGLDLSVLEKKQSDARRRAVLASHTEIYAAIERSDALAAKVAMESHLQENLEHTLRRMTRGAGGSIARNLTPDELAYNT